MRSKFFLLSAAVLILLVSSCQDSKPDKSSGNRQGRTFPVRAVVLEPSSFFREFNATGTFEPNEQVMVATEIPGRIENIHFTEGDFVNQGQLLVSINADDIRAERRRLQSALKNARSKAERGKRLRKIEAISEEELEDLLFEVESLENQLSENEVRLNRTQIRAPFSGVTGFRQLSPGAFVNTGDEIVELVQYHPLKVQFELPQRYADKIKIGDSISIDYGENTQFKVPVASISYRINEMNRAFEVRTVVDNKNQEILPGSFASINVPVYETDSALLIPSDAVIKTIDEEEVFVVKNGTAQKVKVQTGMRNERAVEIKKGCQAGDTVIITGLVSLSNGNKVNATLVDWQNSSQ